MDVSLSYLPSPDAMISQCPESTEQVVSLYLATRPAWRDPKYAPN